MLQHESLEKLNLQVRMLDFVVCALNCDADAPVQAHHSAQTKHDEFVVRELTLIPDKVRDDGFVFLAAKIMRCRSRTSSTSCS